MKKQATNKAATSATNRATGKAANKTGKKAKPRSRRKILIPILVVFALILIGIGVFLYIYLEKRVFKNCEVEAGTPVAAADFVRFDMDKNSAAFKYGTSHYDVHVPGEYPIEIQLGSRTYHSVLKVSDTIAPKITLLPRETMYNIPLEIQDFVSEADDETECTLEYVTAPDFAKVGEQQISILCTDKAGNTVTESTYVRVIGIYPEIVLEAGDTRPDVKAFAFDEEEATLLTPLNEIDMNQPGDYTVSFSVGGVQYDSILHLKDTKPPKAEGIQYEGFASYPLEPKDLINGLSDATQVKLEFVEDPHFETPGERDVQIRMTDLGGNEQIVTSHIKLEADTEPPVISGTKNISVITNEAIAYKEHVTVTDNADKNITYTVDNSQVNLKEAGTYPVTYSAVDGAGNETKIEIKVTVVYKPYTEDDLWELCDQILKQIINDKMTEKQKVEAIFNWVDWSIAYKGHAEKISWIQGAYEGIKNRVGDCFNVASACHALYTRAGIETFMIERYPITYAQHFWNAVKIDGVWYHCDALTKEDGTRFFMWDSAKIKAYSDTHRGYHYYDASKYPVEIP